MITLALIALVNNISTANLSILTSDRPTQGSLSRTSGAVNKTTKITYTPNGCISNANQTDSLNYTIDSGGISSTATVAINFDDTIKFTNLYNNIFSTQCKSCHKSGGTASGTGTTI